MTSATESRVRLPAARCAVRVQKRKPQREHIQSAKPHGTDLNETWMGHLQTSRERCAFRGNRISLSDDVQQDQTPTLKEDGRVVTYDMMTSYFFSALASLAGGGFMPTVNWRIFKAPPSRMSMAPQNTVTLVASPLLGSLPKMSVSP